jgi:hypothetical protein
MTDEQNTKCDALIPSSESGLITQSAELAKRGLALADQLSNSIDPEILKELEAARTIVEFLAVVKKYGIQSKVAKIEMITPNKKLLIHPAQQT